MTWLVDANIISEIRKGSRCHRAVAAWWASVQERDLFLSALTLGEIRQGIEGVGHRDPAKAAALELRLRDVSDAFGARIIGVDLVVAEPWGRISAARSIPVINDLLAATAPVHDLVLVTRDAADVSGVEVRMLNPFDEL